MVLMFLEVFFFCLFVFPITSSVAAVILLLSCIIQSDTNCFQRTMSVSLGKTLSFLFSAEGLHCPSSRCESNYTNNMHTVLLYLQKLLPKAQTPSSAPLLSYFSSLLYKGLSFPLARLRKTQRGLSMLANSSQSIIWTHLASA